MSNVQVGTIYQQVISKVIEASENDFLENGVEQTLLQELREGWQKRLTDLKGANYPWDPTPTVPPQPPTVPSNVPKVENGGGSREAQPQQISQAYNGQQIKQEVKVENYDGNPQNGQAQPAYSQSGLDRNIASQRAAALLRQQYGNEANQSIAQMNRQTGPNPALQQQQNQQRAQNMPPGAQQRQQPPMNLQMPAQRQQQHNLYQAQNDGAADWEDHKIKIEDAGESGRHAADAVIRNQVQAMSQQQDSGLMAPLNEQPAKRSKKARKAARAARRLAKISETGESSTSAREPHIPQLDGLSDDDEDTKATLDEDAINSDLDDTDEGEQEDDEDSAEIGDIMLCTYDKVQRVKNKWKCVLKDGILTTNGKDYVFHKATGEFEW